jgi:hypothetical protein
MMRKTLRRVLLVSAAALGALGLIGAGAASAFSTVHNGSGVTHVAETTQTDARVFTGGFWTTVDQVNIAGNRGDFVDAQYTAESACYGGAAGNWCSVRILVDNQEAEPVVGSDFAFSPIGSPSSWASHTVDRTKTLTYTGVHRITVQTLQVGRGTAHRLDDWTLRVLDVRP